MTLKRIRFEGPREGVTLARFREVWEHEHAPRMAKRTNALRYIGTFFEAADGVPPLWEHAVSLWYRDAEHQRQAYAGPRDTTDPMGTVIRPENVLLETKEFVFRAASEAGLSHTWYAVSAGGPHTGTLPAEWRRSFGQALSELRGVEPVRVVVSMVTGDSTSHEMDGVIELGYVSPEARSEGDRRLASQGGIWASARYRVGDQVAIIGDLSDRPMGEVSS